MHTRFLKCVFVLALSCTPAMLFGDTSQVFHVTVRTIGGTDAYFYSFTDLAVCFRSHKTRPDDVEIGFFHYSDEQETIHITWLTKSKPMSVKSSETVKVDVTTTPVTFQILRHTEKSRQNSVVSARKVTLPTDLQSKLHRDAQTAVALYKANASWQRQMKAEQLEILQKYQEGMGELRWKYNETLGRKLGI